MTTTRNSVTIPDPTAHGLAIGMPSGADYDWLVFGHGVEGMGEDALLGGFAGYIDLLYTLMIGGPGPSHDGAFMLSTNRAFQVAP